MALKYDYQRIARRSLDASQASLIAGIQEKSAFLSYHAFESTGSALSCSCGLPVGPQVHHNDKILHFKAAARICGNEHTIAGAAVSLAGIRNRLLYPVADATTGAIVRPENAITRSQAERLRRRVNGIVNWVDSKI